MALTCLGYLVGTEKLFVNSTQTSKHSSFPSPNSLDDDQKAIRTWVLLRQDEAESSLQRSLGRSATTLDHLAGRPSSPAPAA